MKWNIVDWIALVLVIVGGINWGLVGFFDWKLVNAIFGSADRIIYAIVGIAALYSVYSLSKAKK